MFQEELPVGGNLGRFLYIMAFYRAPNGGISIHNKLE